LSGQGVSSPASTGGAGTVFEYHVGAHWLTQLLVRAIPPILLDCTIADVHFQTEHLGWRTDDFLIIGKNGAGAARKLAGQVKRKFTVSEHDEDCKKAFGDFWEDFKKADPFSPDADRMVLVTLRGTNTMLEHFSGLLDCARAARSATEFERRLNTKGFLSKQASEYCDSIRAIVGAAENRPMSVADIWPFLRVLHVLSLDLETSTAQTEAAMRTLLAHTAGGPDPAGAALETWNALVVLASAAIPEARSFEHDDLPADLRERHAAIGTAEHKGLKALKDHSTPVLAGIRSTIGATCRLSRAALVQDVVDELQASRVVVITGAAGSGKSAIAKDVIGLLSEDQFAFSFRAEEFAQPHIDTALQNGQIPLNAVALRAILAGQERKVLLVESVERLLEKSMREAFNDLLRIVAGDASFQVLLTCRDYSADQVRASFLAALQIAHSVVEVPVLDDTDLKEVETAYPDLARPLAHPPLRGILRNPYLLDKALLISWAPERPLPESEREFRRLFWQQIVRDEAQPADGMPRKREEALEQIAVRRARALTAYVPARDLDPVVIDRLKADSLVGSSEQSSDLLAPAHDVLEDWAILQWIEQQHAANGGSFAELSETIGTHPAVRRSYRKWVAELLERDAEAADRLFSATMSEGTVSAQFRDDTLVSLLRATSSAAFLEKHEAALFANDKVLLKRVIHLLRVACVTTAPWFTGMTEQGGLFRIPDGPAWPAVLKLVEKRIDELPGDRLLVLGLIDDWARGVSVWTPYPKGAVAAASIAHALLPHFDTDREEGNGRRILKVIARIPKAAPDRLEAVLRGATGDDERDRVAEDFQELVFDGMEGTAIARDLPDILTSVAPDYLFCTQEELESEFGGSSLGVELNFGIKERLHHSHFPASAYRGAWLPLLRYHPTRGMDLVVSIFNHSADWYAHPRVSDRLEPAFEIELTFSDGTTRRQWVNGRFWNLYRGTSVAPYVLQSIAMAVERWLLEVAESTPDNLDATLLDMLRRSNCGALTAVAASLATAFPHAAGETLLVLLQSPDVFWLDTRRVVNETQAPSSLHGMFPTARGEDGIYNAERKDADAKEHRKSHLETAILNLQLGPLAPRVHEILDRQRAALPEADERSEDDRIHLLSISRMDLRTYSVTVDAPPAATSPATPADSGADAPTKRRVRLEPGGLAPDVQQMVDDNTAKSAGPNARLTLLLWALKVFEGEQTPGIDPAAWREWLGRARTLDVSNLDESAEIVATLRGPHLMAAVCVRDHWDELSDEERQWCIEHVCAEIAREADTWNQMARAQRHSMSADRACASVVSLLFGKTLSPEQTTLVRDAFVKALTNPITEVQWHAVSGIERQLWTIDRPLTLLCINALAEAGTLVDLARPLEDAKPYTTRKPIDAIEAEVAADIRNRFWTDGAIAADAHTVLELGDWFGTEACARILMIFRKVPSDPAAIAAYVRAAAALAEWWDSKGGRRRGRAAGRRERNRETEAAISEFIRQFVLRTTSEAARAILQPIVDTIDANPRDLMWFVRGLTVAQDRLEDGKQFWFVWNLFADRIRRATWIGNIDDRYSTGNALISAIFLGSSWKDEVRHWRSLEGYADNVHRLFDDLPPSSTVLDDYVRFLYHVGERSLPQAFVRIARRLRAGNATEMLKKDDTIFMLQVLLQRHVYGRPFELKQDQAVRQAVLDLLDTLVEAGSSAAFAMRDDFVTPISAS
jgi:hypothetical protein